MKFNRRGILQLLAPPLFLPYSAFRAVSQEASDALFVLLDGIDAATPAKQLHAFVEPFLAAEIPIGLVLKLPVGSEADLPADLADELRRIFAGDAAMTEPVLFIPDLAALPRYVQRRTTSDVLQRMRGIVDGSKGTSTPLPVTIATEAPLSANFDALRCLGIRNVLGLGAAPSVLSRGCADLTVCLRGGEKMAVVDMADPSRWIGDVFAVPGWAQLSFSLAGIERASVDQVHTRGQGAADAIAREMQSGQHFLALPREHALWFGDDQSRFVAVRLVGATEASSFVMATLKAELRTLGIPFIDTISFGSRVVDPFPPSACAAMSLVGQSQPDLEETDVPAGLRCAALSALTDILPPRIEAEVEILLIPDAPPAFDDRGLLIRGDTMIANAADLLSEPGLMRDAVLTVGPEDCATTDALQATIETLRQFKGDRGTKLVDLPAFLKATVAPDPIFDLLRATRRDIVEPADPDALSNEELMTDARQAWGFFERFSVPATGLCIDTADVQDSDAWLSRELTMWDLGSLIAAVMAAHELGLIQDRDFVVRAELLVRALPASRIGEWLLPAELISSDTAASLSDDFNACDTGRLLSVLRALDAYPLSRGVAAKKIASWDLGAVIVDGHIHSVVNGRLVDRFGSHCAHYTARAFGNRGLEAASPYDVMGAGSSTDREMRLLQTAADIGPFGAEPLLLEGLEMGLSEPSRLLSDVLSRAQRREYERSGTLYCVSEAPINRAPWFSYQGLNVATSEDRWAVNAASADPRFNTPAFRRETLLANTKAAYLWAAQKPCTYSTLLVRYVRQRARLDGMGFSPGVFAATGQAMPGYADVNTNGIILEAIAFMLRGRNWRPD